MDAIKPHRTKLLLIQAIVISIYYWFGPQGFAVGSSLYVEHQLLPTVIIVAAWLVVFHQEGSNMIANTGLVFLGGFWFGVAAMLFGVFGVVFSSGFFYLAGLFLIVVTIGWAWILVRLVEFPKTHHPGCLKALKYLAGAGGFVIAVSLAFLSKAAEAAPSDGLKINSAIHEEPPAFVKYEAYDIHESIYRSGARLDISRKQHQLRIKHDDNLLYISPCQQFTSAAKSRLPAVFANRYIIKPALTDLSQASRDSADAEIVNLAWAWQGRCEDEPAFNNIVFGDLKAKFVIEADSLVVTINKRLHISEPIYAHQARFMSISWTAASPVNFQLGGPESKRFFPRKPGYPIGPPLMFLTAIADDQVSLFRCRLAEKGPFSRLLKLPNEDPRFFINSSQQTALSFQLAGFVEQASREPSPTAGWEIPANDIIVSGHTMIDDAAHGISINYSLAQSAIGRGYHTVATPAGTYTATLHLSLKY